MLGGRVREMEKVDHQLLYGGFRGGGGQQLPVVTRSSYTQC